MLIKLSDISQRFSDISLSDKDAEIYKQNAHALVFSEALKRDIITIVFDQSLQRNEIICQMTPDTITVKIVRTSYLMPDGWSHVDIISSMFELLLKRDLEILSSDRFLLQNAAASKPDVTKYLMTLMSPSSAS